MFIAAMHNGISRLYETFGNGGTAETVERTLSPSETETHLVPAESAAAAREVVAARQQQLRADGPARLALVLRQQSAALPGELLHQEPSARSRRPPPRDRPRTCCRRDDPRLGSRRPSCCGAAAAARGDLARHGAVHGAGCRRRRPPTATGAGARRRGGATRRRRGRRRTRRCSQAAATEARTFPAGSYIIRMDQPYSRIADALLDYQFWSPDDPQKHPYDDTGWTFPEGFGVECVRVVDTTVLEAPMETVTGDHRRAGRRARHGSTFAINNNGDNALVTLRYRLQGRRLPGRRGFVRAPAADTSPAGRSSCATCRASDLDNAAKALGHRGVRAGIGAERDDASGARAAGGHPAHLAGHADRGLVAAGASTRSTSRTTTSARRTWRKDADLNAKYDVIVFPPAGGNGQSIIDGLPMWRNPMPWKKTAETPNLGTCAQTDDIRPGLGWDGLQHLAGFRQQGRRADHLGEHRRLRDASTGSRNGVSMNRPRGQEVVGSLLRTRLVDGASPIAYGIEDSLAVYSDGGRELRREQYARWPRRGRTVRRRGRHARDGARHGGRSRRGAGAARARRRSSRRRSARRSQPWQAQPISDEQLRNPLNIIPPDQRPRVVLRYTDQRDLLVSGLLERRQRHRAAGGGGGCPAWERGTW